MSDGGVLLDPLGSISFPSLLVVILDPLGLSSFPSLLYIVAEGYNFGDYVFQNFTGERKNVFK